MNWKTIIPLVIAVGTMGIPSTSQAGDEGWAALGGLLLGGAIFGHHHGHHTEYRTVHREVIVEKPVSHGHYEYRTKKVWHPGYYTHRKLPCGTVRKVWEPGYYEHRKVKVWVPATEVVVRHRPHHRRSYYSRRSCDW